MDHNLRQQLTARIFFFDGECSLCNRAVSFVVKNEIKDSKLKFCSIDTELGRYVLWQYAENESLPLDSLDTMIVVNDQEIFAKSDAVLELVKFLKFPYNLMRFLRFVPRTFRNFCYDLIAKNRYKIWGKTEYCAVYSNFKDSQFDNRIIQNPNEP